MSLVARVQNEQIVQETLSEETLVQGVLSEETLLQGVLWEFFGKNFCKEMLHMHED
jgi:hypothetical protein